MAKVVILAQGTPPCTAYALNYLKAADYLICCDGAYQAARHLGYEPAFVVGDGDSLLAADKARLGARFIHVAEQDTNDLEKAFRFVVGLGPNPAPFTPHEIVIVGATGRREDHTLGNIFRLLGFQALLPAHAVLHMVTDTGCFDVITATATFATQPGRAVSIFAPDAATRVHSEGLVWPLDAVAFTNLWCATLNRTSGTSFTLQTNRPILLFQAFDA